MIQANTETLGEIIHVNDEAELLTGYKRKEAIGKNVTVLMPALVGDTHDKCLKKYLDTGKTHFID